VTTKRWFGVIVVLMVILALGSTAALAASPTTQDATTRVAGRLFVQDTNGMTYYGAVPGLVDPAGNIQIRALANAASWLSLSWDNDNHIAILENTVTGVYLRITETITICTDHSAVMVAGSIHNINDRIFVEIGNLEVWRELGIGVWYSASRDDIGWLNYVQIEIYNPTVPAGM